MHLRIGMVGGGDKSTGRILSVTVILRANDTGINIERLYERIAHIFRNCLFEASYHIIV